jgi:hypothetical protein
MPTRPLPRMRFGPETPDTRSIPSDGFLCRLLLFLFPQSLHSILTTFRTGLLFLPPSTFPLPVTLPSALWHSPTAFDFPAGTLPCTGHHFLVPVARFLLGKFFFARASGRPGTVNFAPNLQIDWAASQSAVHWNRC